MENWFSANKFPFLQFIFISHKIVCPLGIMRSESLLYSFLFSAFDLCSKVRFVPHFITHFTSWFAAETSFAEGATLGIKYMTAYRALFLKADAQAGQTVLIHGASGGVGLAACQLAFASSLRVEFFTLCLKINYWDRTGEHEVFP